MDEAIACLKKRGAVVVDPANIPERRRPGSQEQPRCLSNTCSGANEGARQGRRLLDRFCIAGMKRDFNAWLKSPRAGGAGEDAQPS